MNSNNRSVKVFALLLIAAASLIVLSSCLPGDMMEARAKPAGFLLGIWHGWLAPVSLIISIFNPGVTIYETVNTGWWYDFGFYIAIISGFGGISLFRKKRSSD